MSRPMLTAKKLKSEIEGLEKYDIENEEYREYILPNKEIYKIVNPKFLYLRDGGSTHRIVDSSGVIHCIPFGKDASVVLRWKNREFYSESKGN